MKKIVLSAVALALALGFSGCGKKEEAPVEANNTTEVNTTAPEVNATDANKTEANATEANATK